MYDKEESISINITICKKPMQMMMLKKKLMKKSMEKDVEDDMDMEDEVEVEDVSSKKGSKSLELNDTEDDSY